MAATIASSRCWFLPWSLRTGASLQPCSPQCCPHHRDASKAAGQLVPSILAWPEVWAAPAVPLAGGVGGWGGVAGHWSLGPPTSASPWPAFLRSEHRPPVQVPAGSAFLPGPCVALRRPGPTTGNGPGRLSSEPRTPVPPGDPATALAPEARCSLSGQAHKEPL